MIILGIIVGVVGGVVVLSLIIIFIGIIIVRTGCLKSNKNKKNHKNANTAVVNSPADARPYPIARSNDVGDHRQFIPYPLENYQPTAVLPRGNDPYDGTTLLSNGKLHQPLCRNNFNVFWCEKLAQCAIYLLYKKKKEVMHQKKTIQATSQMRFFYKLTKLDRNIDFFKNQIGRKSYQAVRKYHG